MAEATLIPTVIVAGGNAAERERRIAAAIAALPEIRSAVLLEGLSDGITHLTPSANLALTRTASGCLCCTGSLVMKVSLNRLLRGRPAQLYIGVASREHLDALRSTLASPPYSAHLRVIEELAA